MSTASVLALAAIVMALATFLVAGYINAFVINPSRRRRHTRRAYHRGHRR